MDSIEYILAQNVTFGKSSIPKDLLEYFEPAECGECYVCKLVDVFREVRRLLRDDGTLWLNLGDSYNGSGGAGGDYGVGGLKEGQPKYPGRRVDGLKPKDLIGIPWMVAFALRADGWYLRSEIIWHKKAPMPESVRDRPTKAHEQVFLLSKNANYFYDAEAIAEPAQQWTGQAATFARSGPVSEHVIPGQSAAQHRSDRTDSVTGSTRNKRSVWTLGPESYSGAHFATMPTKLVEPCILAGTSAHGCCAQCGAPWERVVEREQYTDRPGSRPLGGRGEQPSLRAAVSGPQQGGRYAHVETLGWQPTCLCGCADVVPCTVLDPFNGSGTTGAVALKHGRRYVGIDLNADYLELAHERIGKAQPLLFEVSA